MPDEGVLKPITRANPPRHRRDEARQHASTVDHLRLPSVAISSGAKRSLGTEPLSRAEPEVRIHLPPAESHANSRALVGSPTPERRPGKPDPSTGQTGSVAATTEDGSLKRRLFARCCPTVTLTAKS